MDTQIQTRILAGLAFAQSEAHATAERFGYWEKIRSLDEVFILIHRDTVKALEVLAAGDGPSDKLNGFKRSEEKLADIIIRILDIAGGTKLDVASAVIAKMVYNHKLSQVVRKDF